MQQLRVGPFRGVAALSLALAMACVAAFCSAPSAQARMLRLDRLPPQVVAQMSADARDRYEEAFAAVDHVLYERALSSFQDALKQDPANEQLRFIVIKLAYYLGDTRWGPESDAVSTSYHLTATGGKEPNLSSLEYYRVAIDNLNEMASSPQLNPREQERARRAAERLTAMQQTVTERDEKRRQWGKEIDTIYLKNLGLSENKDKDKKGGQPGFPSRGAAPAAAGSQARDENASVVTAASPVSMARSVASDFAAASGTRRN